MFTVRANKYGKITFSLTGIICIALVVIMGIFFNDFVEFYSESALKVVIPVIYIALMVSLLYGTYEIFDFSVLYLVVEQNGFRIKHLFRKEVMITTEQVTKWTHYLQFLRNGQTSENIIIYYNNDKSKIEFRIREFNNFERLLDHLNTNYKTKRVNYGSKN